MGRLIGPMVTDWELILWGRLIGPMVTGWELRLWGG